MNRYLTLLVCVGLVLGVLGGPGVASASPENGAQNLTSGELTEYTQMQADAEQAQLLETVGGAEAGTGTIVLAVIGALVLVGAVLAAAAA